MIGHTPIYLRAMDHENFSFSNYIDGNDLNCNNFFFLVNALEDYSNFNVPRSESDKICM